MQNEDISTYIHALEKELEELRKEFANKVNLIEGKLTLLNEQLPTKKVIISTHNNFSK